jgi:hypothetical protein
MKLIALAAILPLTAASIACAAPDEEKLGKASGYPVGNAVNWYYDESVRVGSFTHEADIPGIFHGKVNVLKPSPKPMALPKSAREPDFRWNPKDASGLSMDDYLARQRIMGLIIVKDGVAQAPLTDWLWAVLRRSAQWANQTRRSQWFAAHAFSNQSASPIFFRNGCQRGSPWRLRSRTFDLVPLRPGSCCA